jgi:putative cell wall-binding protein
VAVTAGPVAAAAPPAAPACDLAPLGSYWSADVRELPVHPQSATFVATIGADRSVHPDFGSGTWEGGPIGIPFTTVGNDQPEVAVSFLYDSESDHGPYPIPPDALIEGGPDSDGDRHVLVVNRDTCVLSELYAAYPQNDGSWAAGSGAVFDLTSHELRPAGWTSADAAGLPILPGLVRYDEVAAGAVEHAIRLTVPRTRNTYVWPARHQAGVDDSAAPPMGSWVRLRADVDLSELSPQARIIATALKTHGGIVADNGSAWYLSGVPDERWDNDDLRTLRTLTGTDFEVVEASSLRVDADRGATVAPPPRHAGSDRIATAAELARAAFPDGSATAVLANAFVPADALAAGPLAAAHAAPLLLTGRDDLPAPTSAVLADLGVADVIVAGGPAAVSEDVVADLRQRGFAVHRIAGADRYETAARLAGAFVDVRGFGHRIIVAAGEHPIPDRQWPDALVGTPAAMAWSAPLLLVRPSAIPPATEAVIRDLAPQRAVVLGGPATIDDGVQAALRAHVPTVDRIAGSDRYATAVAIADAIGTAPGVVVIATGQRFPDALAAGPAAVAWGGVVLLTPSYPPAPSAMDALAVWRPDIHVVGGPTSVSDAAATSLAFAAG